MTPEEQAFRDCIADWRASQAETPVPEPRATPARPLRLRLHFDRLEGPPWLGLLAQCAWLRGGILAPATV